MRKLLVILALLFTASLAFAGNYVNGNTCGSTASSSPTCAVTLSVTAGYTVGVSVQSASSTTNTVTDTNGDSIPSAFAVFETPGYGYLQMFTGALGTTNGSEVITIHFGGSCAGGCTASVGQYSGGFGTVDKTQTGAGDSTSFSSGASGTIGHASELLLGGCATYYGGSQGTMVQGTGWTLEPAQLVAGGGGTYSIGMEDQTVSSTGSYTATMTDSHSVYWACGIVTLYAAPGTVQTPSCTPGTGTYNSGQSVTCTDGTGGATVCYTTDGSTPAASTPGTCSHGSAYSGALSITSNGTNLQAIGTETGYVNSSVVSYTYTLQVATPAPVYGASGATTFTDATSGASLYYNNTGSTATCASTLYTGAVYASGTNPISIIGCLSGYSNSSVLSVQPDIPAASDNLQAYYNSNWRTTPTYQVGPSIPTTYAGIPFQNPLDCAWTACAWQTATSSGGEIYPENDPTLGGSNVDLVAWNNGDGNLIQSLRVAEGYNANQGALVYLHSNTTGTYGGPAVRCNASGSSCISLIFTGQTTNNLISLYKGTGASYSALEYTSSSVTLSDGAFAELRAVGCVYTPLLNGSPISGLPAFTDTGCAQSGQPGAAMIGKTLSTVLQTGIYAPSFYNIGGTSSGYTPPSVPTPTTYTDASLNTASIDMEPPGTSSWFHFDFYPSGGWTWGAPFTGTLVSGSNYAVGPASTSTQYEFRGVFGLNQWEAYTVNVAPWTSNLGWWLSTLLNQPWIYGSASGCNTAGTLTSCFDTLSYYLGITASNNYTCDASKDEYCHTPFVHGTKVTPAASPGNQVGTFAASHYTLLPGDLVETRYLNGYVEDWCKQGSSPASWAPSHTYAAGSWIEDSNGGVQYTASGGTSQSGTHPAWNGSWIGTGPTSYGETTTDGTVTWAWYGIICPTTTKYTNMIRVPDPDLGNPSLVPGGDYTHALGIGFPGLATYGGGAGLPVYNNWSAGTVGYGTGEPCATAGQCQIAGSVVSNGVF